jgi:hypothetical protein
MSITESLLRAYIDARCPSCNYVLEVQLVDARTQVYRRCPCCRNLVHLIDYDGSVYGATGAVERAVQEIEKEWRRQFR